MKFIFILLISFLNYFPARKSLKAAEKINIQFEEMSIPISIEQLSNFSTNKYNSNEVTEWFTQNGFNRFFELSKYLEFPIFKEGGLTRQILRSWIGRRVLSELSNTIIVPNDLNGVEVFNTIENLLDTKEEISTLEILRAIPTKEINLDLDNLILIIASWKRELAQHQKLISKLNEYEALDKKYIFKESKDSEDSKEDIEPIKKELSVLHRSSPLSIEIWKPINTNSDKDLIILMPGLGGDISNFRWIANKLSKEGWPILFIDHQGTNSEALLKVIKGDEVLPGGADVFLYRIKDLNAVITAHRNGSFLSGNKSYILMGHSLGSLISFLYAGNLPEKGFEKRCENALTDLAITNLSKLLQCQLSEISLPYFKELSSNLKALIGFNSFGSIAWPTDKSSGISTPVLFLGGTYDLITPLLSEQFKVFLSTSSNPLNRFLVVEGASHFAPIRLSTKKVDKKEDIFQINKNFVGSNPFEVQNLSVKVIIEFLNSLEKGKGLDLVKNQNENKLNFHILDAIEIKKFMEN